MSQRSVLEIFDNLTSATYLLSDDQPSVVKLLDEAKAARAAIVELVKAEAEYDKAATSPVAAYPDQREYYRIGKARMDALAKFNGKA